MNLTNSDPGLAALLATPEHMSFAIVIPTLNAAGDWQKFCSALLAQAIDPNQVLVLDSMSSDRTAQLARENGFRVASIPRGEFNHGATRQLATQLFPQAELLVYMTQDAILADPSSIQQLLRAFNDARVGAAYGRQLPRETAGFIEAHDRLFNYPDISEIRSLESRNRLGLKAIFISNSFAAYRRSALTSVGGFPSNVIFGEDTITAARLLLKDWRIAYVAESRVYHSHAYTMPEIFRRYFDIGVLHAREPWLMNEFGKANSEGKRYVYSELKYLWKNNSVLILKAVLRTLAKLAGYKIGRNEARLNTNLKRHLSMNSHYWK